MFTIKRPFTPVALALALSFCAAMSSTASARPTPLDTAFTYQGQLKQGGSPYSGTADFQFALFDVPTGGTALGSPLAATGVTVSGGVFSVSLDFGSLVFNGDDRWLEIAVHTPGNGGVPPFTTLTPRQKLSAAPYALHALSAIIAGAQPNQVNFSNPANTYSGASLSIDSGTLHVDSANNRVGIGTTGPLAQLDVFNQSTADINTTAVFRAPLTGPNVSQVHVGLTGDWYIRSAANGGNVIIQDTPGNVGIGTASPTSKLQVNGTITATALSISTTTRRHSIPAAAFQPYTNSTGSFVDNIITGLNPGEFVLFVAPVTLPDGAVITQMDAQVVDNAPGASENLTLDLMYTDDTGAAASMASAGTTGAAFSVQTITSTTISSPTVDNLHRSYYLRTTWTTPSPPTANNAIRLTRVAITYTITSPLP